MQGKPDLQRFSRSLDDLRVTEMSDGGMGSLSLIPTGLEDVQRSMGKQLVTGEWADSDGVLVSASLNLDKDGLLYELDVWKVDFSPLLRWPQPLAIRIVEA